MSVLKEIEKNKSKICQFSLNLKLAYVIVLLVIVLFLCISDFVIYFMLIKAMKTGLNSMYLKKKDDVRFILIVSFICVTIFTLFNPLARYKFEDPAVIYHTGYYHKEPNMKIYLILIFLFLFNLPYFIYGLVTVRNIDVKLYM